MITYQKINDLRYKTIHFQTNKKGHKKMKSTLEKLWNEHLSSECAVIDTDEERLLTKRAAEVHEKANATLNYEQKIAVEKFVDALCDAEVFHTKKAFFKGCEFAVSFLLESGDFGK